MRFLMCRVHTCSEHLAVFCQRGGMGGPPAASRASFCVCFWLLLLRDLWEAIVVERIRDETKNTTYSKLRHQAELCSSHRMGGCRCIVEVVK